jgi:hypothetical protein
MYDVVVGAKEMKGRSGVINGSLDIFNDGFIVNGDGSCSEGFVSWVRVGVAPK